MAVANPLEGRYDQQRTGRRCLVTPRPVVLLHRCPPGTLCSVHIQYDLYQPVLIENQESTMTLPLHGPRNRKLSTAPTLIPLAPRWRGLAVRPGSPISRICTTHGLPRRGGTWCESGRHALLTDVRKKGKRDVPWA